MSAVVKLQDIIDGMEMQMDETSHYINLKTGEVLFFTQDEMLYAEDDEPPEYLNDWEKEQVKKAGEVLYSDDYIALPDRFEINEYQMMEHFCNIQSNDSLRFHLLNAIQGSGAFGRFKNAIHHEGIEKQWYRFKADEYKEAAIEWCEENKIKYTEEGMSTPPS